MEIPVVKKAIVIPPYSLDLLFEDGTRGVVNLEKKLRGEVFVPLRDPKYFAKAEVDDELGTVVWPNGADFAPESLYEYALASAKAKTHVKVR